MNKQQYLDKLELELRRLNVSKVNDVLADYNEHFMMGQGKGKSEQEIIDKLGDPLTVAKAYQAENFIATMESSNAQDKVGFFAKAFGRALILTPFNFFMIIGPFLVLACLMFGGWAVALTICGTGVGIALALLTLIPLSGFSFWAGGAAFFTAIFLGSLGLLFLMGMLFVSKLVVLFFVNYMKWNIDFVKGSRK